MKIKNFFNDEYINSAVYQSYRAIANVIDGFKPSARKVVYTVAKSNIKDDIKVSILQSKVSSDTQYLHGEQSLHGVIVGLAKTHNVSNNVNLLEPEGSFGTRFIPDGSAAGRYIYTRKSNWFDKIIRKEDFPILDKQFFEGDEIEPKFFVPIVPLLLVNGSNGIGNGFAQDVYTRSLVDIINQIERIISGKKPEFIPPSFKGFTGSIERIDDGWVCKGSIKKIDSTTIEITELPIFYNLRSYCDVLDKLVEKDIIKDYEDQSENDTFNFIIKCSRDFVKQSDNEVIDSLKLSQKFTENFTCVGLDNKIIEFKNEKELLSYYCEVRLQYYKKRKKYQLAQLKDDIRILSNKKVFIKGVMDGDIIIKDKSKSSIINKVKPLVDEPSDDFDYMLNMPVYSMSKEKFDDLCDTITKKKKEYKDLDSKEIENIWLSELKEIKE